MKFLRAILLAVILAAPVLSGELRIAAASDLKFALDELVREFGSKEIKVTYGSSGNFFAQLQNRAPFDLYFSADVAYPRKLVEAGLGLDTNVFVYGIGRIVLWSPKADVSKGFAALTNATVRKVAIANPKHAPYGMAAVAAMKSLGVYDAVEPKLVLGENIAQAAQFVESGAADVGIIALSLALAPQMKNAGEFCEIPLDAYPKMEQGGIILKWTKDAEAARAFRDFVTRPRGREVLRRFGFYER